MVLLKSFLLSGLAAVAAARSSAVIDLIPDNFDKLVFQSGKPTLVEFFAPWCGHCKNLAPVYEELALNFEFAKDKVQIAKVDADANRDLGQRFGVQGFPTLKWFDGKSETPQEYNSGRDLDSLSNFITEKTNIRPKKKMAPPSKVVMLTDNTFDQAVGGDKAVLVAFTAPWCGHCKALAPTWETLAEDFASEEDVVIAKVDAESENSKAVAEAQGVTSYPTIKFFPKGSKEPEPYNGGRQEKDFIKFLNEKTGTHRAVGGGLDDVAGTLETFDAIVAKFTGGTSIDELLDEAKTAVEEYKDTAKATYAEYYVRVFSKASKDGDYISRELARLEKILKRGGLAPTKTDEITAKTNILRKFVKEPMPEKDEL